jgi:hypothetical protein
MSSRLLQSLVFIFCCAVVSISATIVSSENSEISLCLAEIKVSSEAADITSDMVRSASLKSLQDLLLQEELRLFRKPGLSISSPGLFESVGGCEYSLDVSVVFERAVGTISRIKSIGRALKDSIRKKDAEKAVPVEDGRSYLPREVAEKVKESDQLIINFTLKKTDGSSVLRRQIKGKASSDSSDLISQSIDKTVLTITEFIRK